MKSSETHKIEVFLPGFLQLLGSQFYTDPKACIRELIQNAHDSCVRRKLLDSEAPTSIHLTIDPERRTITIADNGAGMTIEEVHKYVSTVGRSLTAEFREHLGQKQRREAEMLVGQFGLGLLSAFAIGNRVQITTRSPNHPTIYWECRADGYYTVKEGEAGEIGSQVTVVVEDRHREILDEDLVRRAIKQYADLLNVPIYLGGSGTPVNAMQAPWHYDEQATDVEYAEYLCTRFDSPPMEVIRLNIQDGVKAYGALYIPQASRTAPQEFGDLDVFIRGVFVKNKESQLLPRWARFVRGIVDSPSLTPTLSRDDILRDEVFFRIKAILGEKILAFMEHLAQKSPAQLQKIVHDHNFVIKKGAFEDNAFFDRVADMVQFETSVGLLNLPEYLKRVGFPRIIYMKEGGRGLQKKILFKARGIPVIDASLALDEAFLLKYGERHPEVQVQTHAEDIFQPLNDEEQDEKWGQLVQQYFSILKLKAEVMTFEPEDLPAVLLGPGDEQEVEINQLLQALLASDRVSDDVKAIFKNFLKDQESNAAKSLSPNAVLVLNAKNEVIYNLRNVKLRERAYRTALKVLFNNALLLSQQSLSPEEALKICRENNEAVDLLVKQALIISSKL